MIPSRPKPRVFIGSSVEGLPYANAVFTELERAAEPTVWDQDVFSPMRSAMDALETAIADYDFAVLALTPDDVRVSRRRKRPAPRDNLVLELGLFVGALGRDRVFFLKPRAEDLALPTDLAGVAPLEYVPRSDKNLRAAVRTACQTITGRIQQVGFRRPSTRAGTGVSFWHTLQERKDAGLDVPKLIQMSRHRVFISGIALNFVVQNCKVVIRERLQAGVRIELALARNDEQARIRYSRFTRLRDPSLPLLQLAYDRYAQFAAELLPAERDNFGVYGYPSPMAHSIGVYDEAVYISEFCLDADASDVPSYGVQPAAASSRLFLNEAKVILAESDPLFGSKKSQILKWLHEMVV